MKITQAWDAKCETHTQKLVLVALADNANDEGLCWPSIATLSKKCNLSTEGVRQNIKRLFALGFVRVEISQGRTSNRYWILQPPIRFGVKALPTPNGVECSMESTPHAVEGSTPHAVGQPPTPLASTPHAVGTNRKEPSMNRQGTCTKVESDQAVQIYEAYPLKVARRVAIASILKALKSEAFDSLLAKTVAFAQVRNGDLAYCPHPSTWFNQERFNDDPSTWVRKGNQRAGMQPANQPELVPEQVMKSRKGWT